MRTDGVFYAGLHVDGITVRGRIHISPDRIEAKKIALLDASESLVLAHEAKDVEVLVARLVVPWAALTLLLRSHGRCIPAIFPIWNLRHMLALLQRYGYEPHIEKHWFSTGYLKQQ
jgi:hypothetical protein